MGNKPRLTPSDLDARLKFVLGIILGTILLFTTMGILYALIFVTQPVNAQSENDKMFFNVLGSVATFITGTLAGLLIGRSGAQEMMAAMEEKKVNGDTAPVASASIEETPVAASPDEAKATAEAAAAEPVVEGKPNSQMPEEQPIDNDWDKED